MGIPRKKPELALIIVAIATLATFAACSPSPRFTAHPGREPEPVTSAESSDTSHDPTLAIHDDSRDSALATDSRGDDVIRAAQAFIGAPYRSGGTTEEGVDCSGLTFAVYRSIGVRLPRSSDDQARIGVSVDRDALVPGDLIFFGNGSGSITHVGIYAGDNEFIHASTRARSVRFDRLDNKYFRNRYVTARRVIDH